MKPKIEALKKLVDQFPQRKRVEYNNPNDQQFVTEVLTTLKAAWPDIQVLGQDLEEAHAAAQAQCDQCEYRRISEQLIYSMAGSTLRIIRFGLTGKIDKIKPYSELLSDELLKAGRTELAGQIRDYANGVFGTMVTILPVVPSADSPTPSNAASPEQGKPCSTRIQEAIPSLADTASDANRTADTSGKPAASANKFATLRASKKKAAASRRAPSAKTSAAGRAESKPAALPEPPPATHGDASA